jgi:hypothetical protein
MCHSRIPAVAGASILTALLSCASAPTPARSPGVGHPDAPVAASALPTVPGPENARPAPAGNADVVSALLPLPLSELPPTLRSIRFGTITRRDVETGVCGDPAVEDQILDHTPTDRVRSIARALRASDETRAGLSCRRALAPRFQAPIVAHTVVFSTASSSHESVELFRFRKEPLPPTSRNALDAKLALGLEPARCFAWLGAIEKGCSELDESIASWPASDYLIMGRVTGVAQMRASAKEPHLPHPQAGAFRAMLPHAVGITDVSLEIEVGPSFWGLSAEMIEGLGGPLHLVHGVTEGGSARLARFIAHDEAAAKKVEAQLRAHLRDELTAASKPLERGRCDDCAPGVVEERATRHVFDRKRLDATTIDRVERVVTKRVAPVVDPAHDAARAALSRSDANRAAKARLLIDRWIDGTVPAPEDFLPITGPSFVRALRKSLAESP